jgi:ubiquitin C-terminal hydrolase
MQQFDSPVSSTQEELKNMNVFAVLMKTGSAQAGHFVAYLKCKERNTGEESWYLVDDQNDKNGGVKMDKNNEFKGFPEMSLETS